MHRDYTITRTMNAWPVARIGDWIAGVSTEVRPGLLSGVAQQ